MVILKILIYIHNSLCQRSALFKHKIRKTYICYKQWKAILYLYNNKAWKEMLLSLNWAAQFSNLYLTHLKHGTNKYNCPLIYTFDSCHQSGHDWCWSAIVNLHKGGSVWNVFHCPSFAAICWYEYLHFSYVQLLSFILWYPFFTIPCVPFGFPFEV